MDQAPVGRADADVRGTAPREGHSRQLDFPHGQRRKFNITDGEATDCDNEELRAVCDQIKALGTVDGNVLLINIHIAAGDTERPVFFPEAHEARYTNRYASLLYDCSSEMPAVFNEAIREAKGPGAIPPFRGMSYNASAAQLVAMLNIGSISVKTE